MRILPLLTLLAAGGLAVPVPSTTGTASPTQQDQQLTGPLLSLGEPVSQVDLGQHTFGNSWGSPYVTKYNPPDSGTNFTHVRIRLEVSSNGIQYDRLARLYVGGAEIWRSSTSEPTGGAMAYEYTKDVSTYLHLFKSSQDVVLDLGNTANDQVTGAYTTRLTVLFYSGDLVDDPVTRVFDTYANRDPPNNIIPIRPASELTSTAYCYTLPAQSIDFDIQPLAKNTTRVVLDVFASGNGNDEFWYYNMQPENANAFPNVALSGNYPSRLIEIKVGDTDAGVVLPFPVIFSGGFSPSLWIPNVGINAYDLPSYKVDITPLLPKLWAGTDIKISITTGFGNLATSDWYVNANLLLWETEGVTGSGNMVQGTSKNLTNTYSNGGNGADTLHELLSVAHDSSTQAILKFQTGNGTTDSAFVKSSQTLSYTNAKYFSNSGSSRQVAQVSSGHSMLHVSNPGADLSQFKSGIDSDNLPSDFSVVFSDTDSNGDLGLATEWSYLYPLAITDASSGSNSETDIYHGYFYNDPKTEGVWTRQNVSTQSSGSSTSSQYLIQVQKGLDINTASAYEQYSSAANYAINDAWSDSPSGVNAVDGYPTSDSITTTVSNAATTAYKQKSDTGSVNSAIENVFSTTLPAVSISKRSASEALVERVKRALTNAVAGLSRSPFDPRGHTKRAAAAFPARAFEFAPARSPFASSN